MTKSKPIYQGENSGDIIDFFIPKEYDNKDISEVSIRFNYLLPNGVSGYVYLDKDEDDYDNFSLYHFTITTMFTHFAGRVIFWLTLLKDEELTILHTSQSYFDVIETIDVDYGTRGEHEVDERLIQIQSLQSDTIEQLTELKNMIVNYNIPSISLKVDDLSTKVDILETQCNNLIETKLDTSTANELVQEQKDILNSLDQQFNDLQVDIDRISTKIDKTFSKRDREIFEQLQTKVAIQQQKIKTLESNISVEISRLDTTQQSVDDNKANIDDIRTDISTINSDIDDINERIDNLVQPISLLSEENTNVDDGLSQLHAVMGDIQENINNIHNDVNIMQTHVGRLQDTEK